MDPSDLEFYGVRLNEAWFIFADDEHKKRYRESGHNPAQGNFLAEMMKSHLLDKLQDGELQCWGMRLEPGLSDAPECIAKSLFSGDAYIDWENGVLRAYGRTYEGLKVVDLNEYFRAKPKPRLVETVDPKTIEWPSAGVNDQGELSTGDTAAHSIPVEPRPDPKIKESKIYSLKQKMGRPSYNEQLDKLVRELQLKDNFETIPRKTQVALIFKLAKERYPKSFYRTNSPSRNIILEALKRAKIIS
jgi:hypothetical protein